MATGQHVLFEEEGKKRRKVIGRWGDPIPVKPGVGRGSKPVPVKPVEITVGSIWEGMDSGRHVKILSCEDKRVMVQCIKNTRNLHFTNVGTTWEEFSLNFNTVYRRIE